MPNSSTKIAFFVYWSPFLDFNFMQSCVDEELKLNLDKIDVDIKEDIVVYCQKPKIAAKIGASSFEAQTWKDTDIKSCSSNTAWYDF